DLRGALVTTTVHAGQTLAALVIVLGLRAMFRVGVDNSHVAGLRTGVTRERARSIRLMHDSAVQTLESIAMLASLGDDADARRLLAQVGRDAGRGARELRARLSDTGLDCDDPWEPFWSSVRAARDRGQLVDAVIVDEERHEDPQPDAVEAVTGVVQEALTNAWKHSGSPEATVRVELGRDTMTVVVTDDGKGFDAARTPAGFGLSQSIRARAADAGGCAEIESATGRGTVVRAAIPT
ncbi:MAG: sensor histidine kinase, partial [Phycicoccus sp.]